MTGHDNPTFQDDNLSIPGDYKSTYFPQRPTKFEPENSQTCEESQSGSMPPDKGDQGPKRETWGKGVEFLMSCIAMSVGLGNVWRFPFTALDNGGGAFLIPYLIVLILVGRPIYYMEMALGQFSSRGSVKVYDFAPGMRGVGFGQLAAIISTATYYSSVMALIASYLIDSFKNPLPWSKCREGWINCIDSEGQSDPVNPDSGLTTSSQFYFLNEVLKEKSSIEDGIGLPDPYLTMCLAFSWLVVMLILIKGVKSSGKAAYFLALFPYVVLGILLIRSSTLPGAMNGIIYFIKPQWDQLLNPQVWYAAVTQVFFSLSVCFGNVIMYASFNKFDHNIYRDANIVTTLDTFTSLLAGFTIFGILGHLAHEIGTDDVSTVVVSGAGLAFISYPDAIAKFDFLPQMFSVLFFFMLFVLGIGSNVAMSSNICTVIRDQFPKVKNWQVSMAVSIIGLALGSVYVTPGGQFILELVDYFGASNIVYVLAIGELIALHYVYGMGRFCRDIEFMIGKRPGMYWRLTWGFITPLLLLTIFIYTLAIYSPLTYRGQNYPDSAYACGWTLAAFGVFQLPIWAAVAVIRQSGKTWREKFVGAFKPRPDWGPVVPSIAEKYRKFRATEDSKALFANDGFIHKIKRTLFG
ncbi:sodium-dependent nutrient amino acid transporter 1-like isoform X2 [Phlebotomus papatasi]|uniref:Transporter n=1 Tax=Phlebotomus papatasi TaxID=29031 RepID=A0A1B0DCW8_PHLPP|nr:sodium-dependent nutrient amino acid transporter 1-like isoform X2 [Phlebotomus papatasi]